jgi:hypothetical protein
MIRRFIFYFVGVALGLIAVIFFFGDRSYRFPYMPNDRVLFHLQEHPMVWSDKASCQWEILEGDSLLMDGFLWKGDVDFGRSKVRNVEFRTYVVQHSEKELWMMVEDRDTLSVVLGFEGMNLETACD